MADLLQDHIRKLEKRLAEEPKSPLFARLAGYYLQAGRYDEALRLCDDGIAHHPFYSTAHLVKGKVLLGLNMMAEAKREFEVVYDLLPASQSARKHIQTLEATLETAFTSTEAAEATIEEQTYPEPEAIETPTAEITAPDISSDQPEPEYQAEVTIEPEYQAEVTLEPEPEYQAEVTIEPEPEYQAEGTLEPEPEYQAEVTIEPEPEYQAEVTLESETSYQPEVTAEPEQTYQPEVTTEYEAEQPVAPSFESYETPQPAAPSLYDETDPLAALQGGTAEESTTVSEQSDFMDAFSQLQQFGMETPQVTVTEQSTEEENPFAAFGLETEAPAMQEQASEETFEDFAARIRLDLFGTENTVPLDQYVDFSQQAPAPSNQIEDLAEKLKTPTRLTPVIDFSQKTTATVSEADTGSDTGFVTPTLAEIYAKQGWYDDAIKAYRTLSNTKPAEREKYEKRIAELEALKKANG